VFRPGPTGWRAGLLGGPDIWEVIGASHAVQLRDPGLSGESLVEAIAEATGLGRAQVRAAVRYYMAHPAEIEERIAANEETARVAEAAWQAGQRRNVGGLR